MRKRTLMKGVRLRATKVARSPANHRARPPNRLIARSCHLAICFPSSAGVVRLCVTPRKFGPITVNMNGLEALSTSRLFEASEMGAREGELDKGRSQGHATFDAGCWLGRAEATFDCGRCGC